MGQIAPIEGGGARPLRRWYGGGRRRAERSVAGRVAKAVRPWIFPSPFPPTLTQPVGLSTVNATGRHGDKTGKYDRRTPLLLPVDLRDWVPRTTSCILSWRRSRVWMWRSARVNGTRTGSAQYPPGMLMALLVYSYATGCSVRGGSTQHVSERAVPLRVCRHPSDHDTIATFRRRISPWCRRVRGRFLPLARELGLVRLGLVAVDGTKLLANASKRATLSAAQLAALQAPMRQTAQGLLIRKDRSGNNLGARRA